MPNWASVAYECVGVPKDIRRLHDALMYIDKQPNVWQISSVIL